MRENMHEEWHWELHSDIGDSANPVRFSIGDAWVSTGTTGTPSLVAVTNMFNGVLNGRGYTIHVQLPHNTSALGVVGFIGVLSNSGEVFDVRLTGSVSGNNIVGGLVGLNRGGRVQDNDVSELTLNNTSTNPNRITGSVIGVRASSPWGTAQAPVWGWVEDNIPAAGHPDIGYNYWLLLQNQTGAADSLQLFPLQMLHWHSSAGTYACPLQSNEAIVTKSAVRVVAKKTFKRKDRYFR